MSSSMEHKILYSNKKISAMIRNLISVIVLLGLLFSLSIIQAKGVNSLTLMATPLVLLVLISMIFILNKKLKDKSPVLIVNPDGIINNIARPSMGLIPWDNIIKIYVTRVSIEYYLAIKVQNPEKLCSHGNTLNRLLLKLNYIFFKSPIYISANGLDVDFDELIKIVNKGYKKYGRS